MQAGDEGRRRRDGADGDRMYGVDAVPAAAVED